ncbi:polyprenyl synthetase family protein [Leptospira sp. SA-E8]|uniref:polyprenyl synthetase family protein n=1 Tax=Leptospira sp. SA-E8 TaxID=3422259 RepID=UPI003EBC0398
MILYQISDREIAEGRSISSPKKDVLDRIRDELLEEDFARFYEVLKKTLEPQERYLTKIEYDLYSSGKKIRPMMLLLNARMVHGAETSLPLKVIQGAVSLEMLHVATLIHDDIIDDALIRRGNQSVNAARGMEKAIILGDMQFVEAIRGFVQTIDTQEDMGLVKLVLDTAFRICCGELDELETSPEQPFEKLHIQYKETIDRKTAVLFGLACESGITLAGGRTGASRRAGFYGRRVGRSFQIMDDILDFVSEDKSSGKQRGMDLSRRRLSLPILYAMEELGPDHLVTQIIKGYDFNEEDLQEAIRAIAVSSSFAKSYADARSESLDAIEYLRIFPDNRFKQALCDIAAYVVEQ